MPVVTIDWIAGRSDRQKSAIATEVTQALVEHAEVRPEDIWIRFVDTPGSDWAIAGELQADSVSDG